MKVHNPTQWSTQVVGQPIAAGGVSPIVTDVLNVRLAKDDACGATPPRLISMRARVSEALGPSNDVPNLPAFTDVADSWVVKWGVGLATFTAELDVTAGGLFVAVWCDWCDLGYRRVGTSPLVAQAAGVDASGAAEQSRIGRRTRRGTLGALPADQLSIAIPEGASRMQVLTPSMGPTPLLVTPADSKGVTSGAWTANQFDWLYVPSGSASVTFSQNPTGAPLQITVLFEIVL